MTGLVLEEPRWQVKGLKDPASFFASLQLLVPAGAYLFLEGGSHPAELRRWLEVHNVEIAPHPALGTVWPASRFYSVSLASETPMELAELTKDAARPEVCHHLHVYAGGQVLVSGYDAFSDPFYVSAAVTQERVEQFCAATRCRYETC